ncbi:twin-arginine translocation pathway signal [Bradyrhizobium canariense]|uniref:Twin-arginine translocation pathway signal n=1 Tax=Bradyrhizobium canariense TaxID=255045 RepID=A0A1H1N0I5_9BRAD|nr:twin-arginine translocation pathway signal [Bradyrhizobium canariense]SDR92496.1 hypothetical protein SAMN05444158_0436 [Bradyrhizobium canariense]
MNTRASHHQPSPRAATVAALFLLGIGLAGCASVSDVGDSMTLAFVDPARYDFYDCKQLESERKSIASHIEELKKQMAKADTGVAGPVVAELAYRNDYIANLGQAKLADQAWRRNNCHDSPPPAPGTASAAPAPVPPPAKHKGARSPARSGDAVN